MKEWVGGRTRHGMGDIGYAAASMIERSLRRGVGIVREGALLLRPNFGRHERLSCEKRNTFFSRNIISPQTSIHRIVIISMLALLNVVDLS